MKVLDVKIRFPFFSVRHVESYQVGISYFSVLPSTLVGAIGYGLGLGGFCKGNECKKAGQEAVRKAREYFFFSQSNAEDNAQEFPLAIRFPIILRRLRGILEGKKLPEGYEDFTSINDAMVREYNFSEEKNVVFVGDLEKIKKAVYLIDRFGDSESLASVLSADEVEVNECNSNEINVVSKISLWDMSGNHVVTTGLDENSKKSLFVFPIYSKDNKAYYSPTKVNDKVRVLCSKDKRIMIPQGDDW